MVTKYQKRIPRPLLECIEIHIEFQRVDYKKLSGDMRVGEMRQFCKLQDEGQSLMRAAMSPHIWRRCCTFGRLKMIG